MAWWTAQEPKGVIGINVVVCAKDAGNGEDGSGIQSHPQAWIISIPPNRLVDCAASGPVVVAVRRLFGLKVSILEELLVFAFNKRLRDAKPPPTLGDYAVTAPRVTDLYL